MRTSREQEQKVEKLEERLRCEQKEERQRGDKASTSEKEASKRAAELTWRLETANADIEASRLALATERERCKQLEASLKRSQEEVRNRGGEAGALTDLLAQAQRHANTLAEAQQQLSAQTVAQVGKEEQENRERLSHLKQKYEQKIAKLHRHLTEREAYERKLKGFIENEVNVLHHYNKELDHYCQWRRGKLPEPPLYPPHSQWSRLDSDKVEKRLLQNLRNLEAQF